VTFSCPHYYPDYEGKKEYCERRDMDCVPADKGCVLFRRVKLVDDKQGDSGANSNNN
jgi:hypothetical protein